MKTEKHCQRHGPASDPYCVNCHKDQIAKEKADDWLARTPCSSCGSRYPNIACNQCRPEWIISLDEANLLVNEVTETRARMADIRDKLTDLRKALNRRPGSLLEKQITDAAICLTNAERIHGGAGAGKPRETPTPLDGASC